MVILFFFFNDTATTEIYTLSLHDALPIFLWYACVCMYICVCVCMYVFVLLFMIKLVFCSVDKRIVLGEKGKILTRFD